MPPAPARRHWIWLALATCAACAFVLQQSERDPQAGVAEPDPSAQRAQAAPARTKSNAFLRATVGGIAPSYSLEQTWSSPISGAALAAADFNGDGRLDLVSASPEPMEYGERLRLQMYLQQGNGVFAAPQPLQLPIVVGYTPGVSLDAADLNEDGKPDLVLSIRGGHGVAYGLATAGNFDWRFESWSSLALAARVQVADVDGDGHLDLVAQMRFDDPDAMSNAGGQLLTYFGDGVGNFPRHRSLLTPEEGVSSELGQLDNDAAPDLLSVSPSGKRLRVQRNDGSGGWLAATTREARWPEAMRSAAIADFSGDGKTDAVAIANTENPGRLLIYPRMADGGLATDPIVRTAGGYADLLRHADLDGNGLTDLVHLDLGQLKAHFFYYLQDEYGLDYPRALELQLPEIPGYPIVTDTLPGDFNGDGIIDIAISTAQQGLVLVTGKLTPYAGSGGLPGAPSVLQVSEAEDSTDYYRTATVGLAAPASDGGDAVTGYTVFSIPGGSIDDDAGSSALQHHLHGLENNKSYTFYARARNGAGQGPVSAQSQAIAFGTPVDPHAPPVLVTYVYDTLEPDIGSNSIHFVVELSKPAPAGGTHFDWSTSDGAAMAGADYIATSGSATIPEGETRLETIQVAIVGDMVPESTEDFHIDLSNLKGASAESLQANVDIYDNDSTEAKIVVASVAVPEGNSGSTVAQVEVRLSAPQPTPVSFDLEHWGNGSTPGEDFQPVSLQGIQIPAGQTSVQVPVTIFGDTAYEGDEAFGLYIYNVQGAVVGNSDGIVLILDDDPMPSLSLANVSVAEGDSGDRYVHFLASLSAPMPHDVSFAAYSLDGSAMSGSDYVSAYQAGLVIPAGQTGKDFRFRILPDTRFEPDESFTARIEDVVGLPVADGTLSAIATLLNDDIPNGIAVEDASITEGGQLSFTVRLSQPSEAPVSFDVSTSPGTAIPDLDYSTTQLQGLVIPPGSTSTSFTVATTQDSLVENNETLTVNLANVAGATVSDGQGLGLIRNDDLPGLSIADASMLEGNEADTSLRFEIRLSSPSPTPVSFILSVTDGSAQYPDYFVNPVNYLTIDPGRTSKVFLVSVQGDTSFEPDETFSVDLSQVDGASVVDGHAVGTILNDDPAPAAKSAQGASLRRRLPLPAQSKHID